MLVRPLISQSTNLPIFQFLFAAGHRRCRRRSVFLGHFEAFLREETSVSTSYLRVRAYPFTEDLVKFIDAHERLYVVEQNRDAQLAMLMKLELSPERCAKLRSVLHYNGLPIDARSVSDDILAQEGFEVAKRVTHASASSMTGGE